MSSAKSNTDGTLYSICVFEDHMMNNIMNDNTSHPMSISVEEYEAYVDKIIDCESQNANDSVDDMGNHLRLIGLIADMTEVPLFSKAMFKEFLLAGLRKIAVSHKPNGVINTYEFDLPKFGTFTAYVETRYAITSTNHHRIIALIVTTGNYPKSIQMTISKRILDYSVTILQVKATQPIANIRKCVDSNISNLIQEFHKSSKVDKIHLIRADLDDTTDMMKKNYEKLIFQGDQLDDLVARSADLSVTSKIFYKKARKLNSCPCCII